MRDNIYVDIHGEVGSVAAGFAEADAIHEMTYSTSRVQHVHLETHGSIAWRGEDGRIHIRTSSQAPFITQQKLCYLFGLFDRQVHVFTERVGGGFGGKQEMLTEDLCALATLKTSRPVKWEFTRAEQFIGATTRHPMTIHVKLGAKTDGTLTAIQMRVVSNTGAYGNHGGETLAASLGSPMRPIAAPTRRPTATPSIPTWCRRWLPRLWRLADDLRHRMRDGRPRDALGIDPFTMRRMNMVRATTGSNRSGRKSPMSCSVATGSINASIWSSRL